MKRFFALALAVMLALTLMTACGGTDAKKAPQVDPKALAGEMLKALAPQGEMLEVTGDVAANYYSIDDKAVKAYQIYISTVYQGEEIAVFQLTDPDKAADVKKVCETRIQDLKDSFDGYLPEQFTQVSENAQVLSQGDIVCLVTGTAQGTAAAKAVFDKAFQ